MRPSIQRWVLPAAPAHPCARGIRASVYSIAAALALGLAANAGAQTIGYNIRTGDVWVDNRLGEINEYGDRHRDPFINEMVTNYDVPRPYVEDLLVRRHWSPESVYYACAYAHSVGRPCSEIVEVHDRGHGWGAVAQRYGMRPGSPEFHAFKDGFVGTYGRWGHPIMVDRAEHVRWDDHGDRMHPQRMQHGKIKHTEYGHDSYRGHGHGNGNGHGKDKGEKHGHGGDNGDQGDGHGHGNGHGKGDDE